ncbi:SDR family NAD(P)-dependent oxidoreductase [Sphingopyxis sp. L1A2A]|uniref:SDR family NAD(P)-dependent oxidoreductase n=1 Tax=Sphingopyxis sp. L1A2A TaxID=2502247 RepID=UPI0024B4A4E3|nr:SDR family NAD(P)-dependent oxidoreductase [Sphingopyxis sp. L1A2A]
MPTPSRPSRRELIAGAAALTAAAPLALNAVTPYIAPFLKGRTILITGASSGFGRVGALLYARLGAKVIATMRGLPRPEAETLTAEAAEEQLDLHIVEIDVTSDASVAAGATKALEIAGGRIDTLINNAGIGITGPVEVQDMEATQLIFDTNIFGIQRMLRALLPQMRAAKKRADFQHLVTARARHRAGRRPLFGDQIRGRGLVRTAGL